ERVARLMGAGDRGADPPARGERSNDPTAPWTAGCHEVIEQAVDHRFVEDPLVAVALEGELERLQFDAQIPGGVGAGDVAQVRLARLRTLAGELGANDLDGVIAARIGVGEGFELRKGGRFNEGHNWFSGNRSMSIGPFIPIDGPLPDRKPR